MDSWRADGVKNLLFYLRHKTSPPPPTPLLYHQTPPGPPPQLNKTGRLHSSAQKKKKSCSKKSAGITSDGIIKGFVMKNTHRQLCCPQGNADRGAFKTHFSSRRPSNILTMLWDVPTYIKLRCARLFSASNLT